MGISTPLFKTTFGTVSTWRIASATAGRLDFRDIDLRHPHHRIERAFGDGGIGIRDRLGERDRRDLPGQSPFILAPTAFARLSAVSHDRIPVTVRLRLINGRNLER